MTSQSYCIAFAPTLLVAGGGVRVTTELRFEREIHCSGRVDVAGNGEEDGRGGSSRLVPGVAHPRDVHPCVQPQPEAQLGGVVLDVADVIDVKFGTRTLPPAKAGRPGQ